MKYDENIDYTKCRFVSDGTWYDKGSDAKCESFWGGYGDGSLSGLFEGWRTCKKSEAEACKPLGTRYWDGEVCSFEEFDIYDESGKLLYEHEEDDD